MVSLDKQKTFLNFKNVKELQTLCMKNNEKLLDNNDDVPFLQRIKIATIPTFDVFVVAYEKNFVVLTTIDEENLNVGGQSTVKKNVDEFITSVACWPVAPSRLTDPRPYEWTAIILGLENGVLQFFTDRGYLLMKQQFSRSEIVQIRIETDQLSILYEDCFVVVNGLTLLAALKACRQKVARGEHVDDEVNVVEILTQKYSLEGCQTPSAVASTGIYKNSHWDQIVTASSCGGFHANLSGGGASISQTPYDTYCATSRDTFVSFNWYTDAVRASDFLSETLHSVTNRFKSFGLPSVGSFWGGGESSKRQKLDPVIDQQRILKIHQRSVLYDLSRNGEKITLSPNQRLAAVCDGHGRVILLDVRKRLALRVWKGYRDAQCGWFEIGGNVDAKQQHFCKILCLTIFAPKRGILEIWTAQNSRRVAAFNVDKDGLLLYCPPTSSAHSNNADAWKPLRFMDAAGHFYIPTISFEIAADKRSTLTYWTAEKKELLQSWWFSRSDDETSYEKLNTTICAINTTKDLRYLVDIIVKTENLSYRLASKLMESILNRLDELCDDEKQKSSENLVLYNYCTALKQCVNFYAVISTLTSNDDDDDETLSKGLAPVANVLYVNESYLLALCEDLDDNLRLRDVNFVEKTSKTLLSLSTFLKSIEIIPSHSANDENSLHPVCFSNKLTPVELSSLGDFLFTPFLTDVSVTKFERDVKPLFGLQTADWTSTLCRFWLDSRRTYSVHPERLYKLFLVLLSSDNASSSSSATNYLTKSRDVLMNSARTAECVSLCLVLRAAAKFFQQQQRGGDVEWENVETNIESWDVLLKILHGVLLWDTFVRRTSTTTNVDDSSDSSTTLNDILSIGYGFPAEEIGKRLVDCKNDDLTPKILMKLFESTSDVDNLTELNACAKRLREIYPSSLSPMALAANCCWENVRRWHANVVDVRPLTKSVEFLQLIENVYVRRGLAALIWQKFLCEYAEELCVVLEDCNNGGEDLDERFWLKTQIPGRSLTALVDAMVQVCRMLENDGGADKSSCTRKFDVEDFVREFFDSFARHTTRKNALIVVSADQPTTSQRRVRVHYILSLILTMIVEQQGALTESTPYLLFTETEEDLLFEHLHSSDSNDDSRNDDDDDEEEIDKRLQSRRVMFLKSWITAVLSQNAERWDIRNALELARLWAVDVDVLRRHEIFQLYNNNRADSASKLLHVIEDRQQLAKDLLELVCKSLCLQIHASKMKPQLSSRLESYLSKFKGTVMKSNKAVAVNLQTCNSIMLFVSSAIPRKSDLHSIAQDLRVVIENLCRSNVSGSQ